MEELNDSLRVTNWFLGEAGLERRSSSFESKLLLPQAFMMYQENPVIPTPLKNLFIEQFGNHRTEQRTFLETLEPQATFYVAAILPGTSLLFQ